MVSETTKQWVFNGVSGGFAAIASAFIQESLSHMIPWLIATFAVILCDLVFGIRKSMMMKEKIRFSMAARRTMGKTVTYFAFVCTVCAVEVASGESYGIDKWSCLVVCFVEFSSILSNILKPKGYTLNFRNLFSAVIGKVSKVDKESIEGIIEEEDKK